MYERQRDFCGTSAFICPKISNRDGADDFEKQIQRLKYEAELLAQDPAHNPYLLLPERQLEELERTTPINYNPFSQIGYSAQKNLKTRPSHLYPTDQ